MNKREEIKDSASCVICSHVIASIKEAVGCSNCPSIICKNCYDVNYKIYRKCAKCSNSPFTGRRLNEDEKKFIESF